jgi:hypothetical protein
VSACAIPSIAPPIIWAWSPSALIGSPTSTAITTLVTRGPVKPSATVRFTVAGRQLISTRQAARLLYSLWMAIRCAVEARRS